MSEHHRPGVSAEQRPGASNGDRRLSGGDIRVVIHRFASFGRVAHVRRWLLGLSHVSAARIESYGAGTVQFMVVVPAGTLASALRVPGTRLMDTDGTTVTLQVDGA